MITLSTDKSRDIVLVNMAGFLTTSDVQRFDDDRAAAVAAMGLTSGNYYMLIDTAACVIQSQDVVAAFIRIILDSPLRAKRLAVIRHDNLTRMQTRRILSVREDAELFWSIAEAEQWLFDTSRDERVASG